MIAIATTEGELARLSSVLEHFGARTTEIVSPSDTRLVVLAALNDEADDAAVAVMLRSAGELAVTRPPGGAALRAWRRDTRPSVVDNRVSFCLAWSEHDRGGMPGLIELGPGGFGNGRHATTELLVDVLVKRLTGGERVLDVGCGSGILGLGALELGAAAAVGVDIKPEAIEAARRNAELNAMGARLTATRSPLCDLDGAFDVVVANIARSGIVELAPQLVLRVAERGWLAVSGLTASQCTQVAEFLHPLVEVERRTLRDWSALVLARP